MSSSPPSEPPGTFAHSRRTLEPDAFREACALFATGVAIAAVRSQDGSPHGLTVTSFSAVSMTPPLVLICIDSQCPFISHFRQGTHFSVNILNESQRELSIIFATKPDARFEGIDWRSGASGAPVLCDCLAALECRTASIVESGDHAIFVGEVEHTSVHGGKPLLYFHRDYRSLA